MQLLYTCRLSDCPIVRDGSRQPVGRILVDIACGIFFVRSWDLLSGLRVHVWSHFSAGGGKYTKRGGPLDKMGWVLIVLDGEVDPLLGIMGWASVF